MKQLILSVATALLLAPVVSGQATPPGRPGGTDPRIDAPQGNASRRALPTAPTPGVVGSGTSIDITHPRYGALPDDGRDDRDAIQAAFDAAAGTGTPASCPPGTYHLSGPVRFTGEHLDCREARFVFTGERLDGPFVTLGSESRRTHYGTLQPPAITRDRREWSAEGAAGDVGLRFINQYLGNHRIPAISDFSTCVEITAAGLNGNVYNTYSIVHARSCHTVMRLQAQDTVGWVNENTFVGGLLGWLRTDPDRPKGSALLRIERLADKRCARSGVACDSSSDCPRFNARAPEDKRVNDVCTLGWTTNNHRFIGTAFECPGPCPESAVVLRNADSNLFLWNRWENKSPVVRLDPGSTGNVIDGGILAESIVTRCLDGATDPEACEGVTFRNVGSALQRTGDFSLDTDGTLRWPDAGVTVSSDDGTLRIDGDVAVPGLACDGPVITDAEGRLGCASSATSTAAGAVLPRVTTLPTCDATSRGQLVLRDDDGDDRLFVCTERRSGAYRWKSVTLR